MISVPEFFIFRVQNKRWKDNIYHTFFTIHSFLNENLCRRIIFDLRKNYLMWTKLHSNTKQYCLLLMGQFFDLLFVFVFCLTAVQVVINSKFLFPFRGSQKTLCFTSCQISNKSWICIDSLLDSHDLKWILQFFVTKFK